jgi:hypothetical protein
VFSGFWGEHTVSAAKGPRSAPVNTWDEALRHMPSRLPGSKYDIRCRRQPRLFGDRSRSEGRSG